MRNAKKSEDRSKGLVLIAEDDVDAREALLDFIEPELPGYGFLMAANGVDALKAFHENRDKVALVLTDNTMPGKTGHELLLDLRKEGVSLPIIMISGDNQPSFVRMLKASGLTEFIVKPIEVPILLSTIARFLPH